MRLNSILGTTFAGIVFLFLLLTMFLPMHTVSGGGSSVNIDVWGVAFSGSGAEETIDWYDDELTEDGNDGVGELRASGPIMIVAIVSAFAALVLGVLSMRHPPLRKIAMIACFVATIFAIIGLILYSVGIDAASDGEIPDEFDNGAAFGLAIAGIIISAFAGVLFLLRIDLQTLLIAPLEAE